MRDSSSNAPVAKKMSTSMVIMSACVIGVAIGLFGLNYWHASKCTSSRSPDEIEEYVEALNRRLLQAESKAIRNGLMLDKMIHLLQKRLLKLETSEIEYLTKNSQDEAVRIALMLASQPAPPMPEFELDPEYQDAEALADVANDIFSKGDQDDDFMYHENYGDKKADTTSEKEPSVSDAEATKTCTEWKEKYSVAVGISWGNLPYDLQQKWLHYSCDYHLGDASKKDSKAEGFFDFESEKEFEYLSEKADEPSEKESESEVYDKEAVKLFERDDKAGYDDKKA